MVLSFHQRETAIQRSIMDYLTLINVFNWRNNNISAPGRKFQGMRGVSDILCIIPPFGKLLCIEVKNSVNGVQSEFQKEFEKKVIQNGAIYLCVSSVDEVIEWYETYTNIATQLFKSNQRL